MPDRARTLADALHMVASAEDVCGGQLTDEAHDALAMLVLAYERGSRSTDPSPREQTAALCEGVTLGFGA